MRRTAPLIIVLLAVLVYGAREQLLYPLMGQHGHEAAIEEAMVGEDFFPDAVASGDTDATDEMPVIEPETPPRAQFDPAPRAAEPIRGSIGRNSSLYVELTSRGISPQAVDRAVRASVKTYNLRKVRPGQRFALYPGEGGELDSLELVLGAEEQLKIRCGSSRCVAKVEKIPSTTTWHVAAGSINSSIFAALKAQEAETELAAGLDEIFGWTIDFISDIRKGDQFAILYERREFEDGNTALGDIIAARIVNQGREQWAFKYTPEKQNEGYYDVTGTSLQKSLRRSPLKLTRVTSSFTSRRYHPVYKTYRPHYGVDYGAPRGTPVYATGDGVVEAAHRYKGNGNYVKIRHNNTYTTYYLHLNGFASGVKRGTWVKQGQLIGYVGSTGAATAPHVCYRMTRSGNWVNPRTLNLPSRDPIARGDMTRFERERDAYQHVIREVIESGAASVTSVVDRPVIRPDGQMRSVF